MDRTFEEGNVFEIWGNIALDEPHHKDVRWIAANGLPAYIGRIIMKKDGFFCGYLVELRTVPVMGMSDSEHPVVGRFIKGRNGRVHVLFRVNYLGNYGYWLKMKLDRKESFGIRIVAGRSEKELAKCRLYGFFTFSFGKSYVRDIEDKEVLASVISGEYKRLAKLESDDFDAFVDEFGPTSEAMFDLMDMVEDENIVFVD